ncbi:MAG: hypothetical protein AB7E32_04355 [Desulfovibrio sp.]
MPERNYKFEKRQKDLAKQKKKEKKLKRKQSKSQTDTDENGGTEDSEERTETD